MHLKHSDWTFSTIAKKSLHNCRVAIVSGVLLATLIFMEAFGAATMPPEGVTLVDLTTAT